MANFYSDNERDQDNLFDQIREIQGLTEDTQEEMKRLDNRVVLTGRQVSKTTNKIVQDTKKLNNAVQNGVAITIDSMDQMGMGLQQTMKKTTQATEKTVAKSTKKMQKTVLNSVSFLSKQIEQQTKKAGKKGNFLKNLFGGGGSGPPPDDPDDLLKKLGLGKALGKVSRGVGGVLTSAGGIAGQVEGAEALSGLLGGVGGILKGSALAVIAVGIEEVIRKFFTFDAAHAEWQKALGEDSGPGSVVDKFESQMSSMKEATHLSEDSVRDLANAFLDLGVSTFALDSDIPEAIKAIGLGQKMMSLSSETAAEYAKIIRVTGGSWEDLTEGFEKANREMTSLGMTTKDMQAIFSEADHQWHNLGGQWSMGVEDLRKGLSEARFTFKKFGMDATKSGAEVEHTLSSIENRTQAAAFQAAILGEDFHYLRNLQKSNPGKAIEKKVQAGLETVVMQMHDLAGLSDEELKKKGLSEERISFLQDQKAGLDAQLKAQGYSEEMITGIDSILGVYQKLGGNLSGTQQEIHQNLEEFIKQYGKTKEGKGLLDSYAKIRKTPTELLAEMARNIESWVHDIALFLYRQIPPIVDGIYDFMDIVSTFFGLGGVQKPSVQKGGYRSTEFGGKPAENVEGSSGGILGGGLPGGVLPFGDREAMGGVVPADTQGKIARAMSRLMSLGASKEQAAGVVGNWLAEDADLSPQKHERGGGPGYGIAQWTTPGRKAALAKFTGQHGGDEFDAQVDFAVKEMKDSGTWRRLMGKTSAESASDLYLEEQEKPAVYNYGPRRANARKAFGIGPAVEMAQPSMPAVAPGFAQQMGGKMPPPAPAIPSNEESGKILDKISSALDTLVRQNGQMMQNNLRSTLSYSGGLGNPYNNDWASGSV